MVIRERDVSSVSSSSTYLHHNDLDLDSLFRRLDKYTAEMDQMGARLDDAQCASDELSHDDLERFSFEDNLWCTGMGAVLPASNSRRASSQIRQSLGLQYESQSTSSQGLTRALDHTPEVKIDESQYQQGPLACTQETHQGNAQVESDWPLVPPQSNNTALKSLKNTKHVVDRDSGEYTGLHGPIHIPQRHWTLPPRTSSRKGPATGALVGRGPRPTTVHRRALTGPEQLVARNDSHVPEQTASSLDLGEKLPPVPGLSHAGSTATLKPPSTPLLMLPSEDQLRRELESFALREGAETLKMTYRNRKPPMLSFVDSDEEEEEDWSESVEKENQQTPDGIRIRRQRSFLTVFQRKKSAVEEVIDMYLDDAPIEKPMPRRTWSTKLSRSISGRANVTKSPPVPALPQSSQGRQQPFGMATG